MPLGRKSTTGIGGSCDSGGNGSTSKTSSAIDNGASGAAPYAATVISAHMTSVAGSGRGRTLAAMRIVSVLLCVLACAENSLRIQA